MNTSVITSKRAARAALVATVVSLGTLLAGDAAAQDRAAMEQRLQRLERMLDSSGMMQLLESVKGLQREVRELRGEIEVQANTINRLKKNQVKLYDDIDQRLQTIESAPPPAAPPVVATGPTAPSTPDRPTSAPAGSDGHDPVKEQQAYQSAFNLLKAGRYEKAAESFRKFLATYSGGKYADNAQYWLGETFYVTRQFETALREFDVLLAKYPESQKRSHAMLKLGYIRDELGQKSQARKVLQQLISTYPNSTAAGLARKRLDRIGE